MGLVKSVRVVGVLEGLMEALEISEAGPEGVPPCSVEPSDALSTPVLSCRSRFLLNLARAFWNQTFRRKKKKKKKEENLSQSRSKMAWGPKQDFIELPSAAKHFCIAHLTQPFLLYLS